MNRLIGQTKWERVGTGALVAATAVVGASIIAEGDVGRALNGVAGLTWFASAAILTMEGRRRGASGVVWAGIGVLTAGVAFVVRPSDLTLASIGFGAAGLAAGVLAPRDPIFWAKLVPTLYLPMHIGTAVLKAAGRSALGMEASIRTQPPPTAAVVPAVMLAAAVAGGWVAGRLKGARSGRGRLERLAER